MIQASLSTRAWAQLLLLALIWGASFLSIRIALDEIGPFWVVAWRTGLAAPLLWLWVWARRLPVPRGPGIWGAFLVMGLLNNAIPFTLLAWGQQHIETGLASILNAATAIFGVIAAAVVFSDERLGPRRAAGVGLGFAGVVAAVGPEALEGLDLRSLAQIAVLGATMSYALAGVWARLRLRGLPAPVAAAGMLTGASVVPIPLALLVEGTPGIDFMPSTYAAILYYTVMATAVAYLLYYRVLAVAGSGNVLLVTLMGARILWRQPGFSRTTTDEREYSAVQMSLATFLLTITNPATIFGFLAYFGALGEWGPAQGDHIGTLQMVLGVAIGTIGWWCTVAAVITRLSVRLNDATIGRFNLVAGAVLVGFGALILGRLSVTYFEVI